mmetsp:Transcript_26448/g.66297  ORF Transcript_26448/g.66297 Transcript_26448/m.66297 type:complete len:81 (+) Transcript_26448:1741-1983(+)
MHSNLKPHTLNNPLPLRVAGVGKGDTNWEQRGVAQRSSGGAAAAGRTKRKRESTGSGLCSHSDASHAHAHISRRARWQGW